MTALLKYPALIACIILLNGCIVGYDHTFLKDASSAETKIGTASLAVTAAGTGSGSKTSPPWALRFTAEGGKNDVLIVRRLTATVDGKNYEYPSLKLDLRPYGWEQILTKHFIPAPAEAESEVILKYTMSLNGGRAIPCRHVFRVVKESGATSFNPFLDVT